MAKHKVLFYVGGDYRRFEESYMQRIKDWPSAERPREKLLQHGAVRLTDAELLALVLRTGDASSGMSALDHARKLISDFGSLQKLACSTTGELCTVKGIGPAKAAEIQAVFEIARRHGTEALEQGAQYASPVEVFRHFHPRLCDHKKESFIALLLDSKNRLIREVTISVGSLTASIVHPREVFGPVIRESAAAVLFVHNHPSGDPTPSSEDIEITTRLRDAGTLMGVRVLDHIIIGREKFVSLAERGVFD
ncbi:MAG TPA: DNA repair protein RadC [Desulfuromonadales bacterium]|nr:DNA repair protein RadC [Desulfuromonadales bacterium]